MITTCYRPDDSEETEGLLAETRNLLLNDMRIASDLTAAWALEMGDSSPTEYLQKLYGALLPGSQNAELPLRLKIGWARQEIAVVSRLISIGHMALGEQALAVQPGFGETLLRDQEKLEALNLRWVSLVNDGKTIK